MGWKGIPLYEEIRFRETTPEYVVQRIKDSGKYAFVNIENKIVGEKEAVKIRKCGSRVRLEPNGKTLTGFPQHWIRIQRLIGLGGVGFVNGESAFLEVRKIIGIKPSYRHNKARSIWGLRIHYDVAKPDKKLERITIEVLLRSVK